MYLLAARRDFELGMLKVKFFWKAQKSDKHDIKIKLINWSWTDLEFYRVGES